MHVVNSRSLVVHASFSKTDHAYFSVLISFLGLRAEILDNLLQENGQKNFEVGEELLVKCASFNAKGIPVFSLLD